MTLKRLLSRVTEKNIHHEVDSGHAVDREARYNEQEDKIKKTAD